MSCDMVVALPSATAQNSTLFGLNLHDSIERDQRLRVLTGKVHAPDEALRFHSLELPQVRQTFAVVGNQPADTWGLSHGVNEHGVAVGHSRWQSRLPRSGRGLSGSELVRLGLERSRSARQALDVLTDLIARHGQRSDMTSDEPGDNSFLVADGQEAFVLEAAGCYWAMLECPQVRAVSDVGLIRQDWRRLAPGMADYVAAQGWWVDDGGKLDFAGVVGAAPANQSWAVKRWGKATVLLEQQNGHIDHHFVRQLLADHFDVTASLRSNRGSEKRPRWSTRFVALLPAQADDMPVAWTAYGPNESPLYLPLFPRADFSYQQPDAPLLTGSSLEAGEDRTELVEKLQIRVDQQTEDFLSEARSLCSKGEHAKAARLAGTLMQNHCELLQSETRQVQHV